MKEKCKKITASIMVAGMALSAMPQAFASDNNANWYDEAINNYLSKGYLKIDSNKVYDANKEMTRAEFVSLINATMKSNVKGAKLNNITDMNANDPYYEDMAKAIQNGWLKGTSANTISPNATITREQACAIFSRLLGLKESDANLSVLDQFSDKNQVSGWATNVVALMVEKGYIVGENGKINPTKQMTRAEGSVITSRVDGKLSIDNLVLQSTWKDGIYKGSAVGYGGTVYIQVEIADGVIKDIQITGDNETPGYLNRAKSVIEKMITGQTTDIDTVTGATLSSNAIIEAVKSCLNQASSGRDTSVVSNSGIGGGDGGSFDDDDKITGEDYDKGLKDGYYEGSAYGYHGPIKVGVTVDKYQISKIDILSHVDDDSYFKSASSVIDKIISKQSTDVDTVSGATFSSNGIIGAVKDALKHAEITDAETFEVSNWSEFIKYSALAKDGDTIKLTGDITDAGAIDGISSATVTLNKNITLDGDNHTISAIKGDVIHIEKDREGNEIGRSEGSANYCFALSGAAYTDSATNEKVNEEKNIIIKNLVIDGASYSEKLGGAMYVETNANANLENVTFKNCVAVSASSSNSGGAIYIEPHKGASAKLYAKNCNFVDNKVADGSTGRGGAIGVLNGELILDGCSFSGNEAQLGGAISAAGVSSISVKNCAFDGNTATSEIANAGNDIYIFDGYTFYKKTMALDSVVDYAIENNTTGSKATFANNTIDVVRGSAIGKTTVNGKEIEYKGAGGLFLVGTSVSYNLPEVIANANYLPQTDTETTPNPIVKKADDYLKVADALDTDKSAVITFADFPEQYDVKVSVSNKAGEDVTEKYGFAYKNGKLIWNDGNILPDIYTLKVEDNSGAYASFSAQFNIKTSAMPVAFDTTAFSDGLAIAPTGNYTNEDMTHFISKINAVTVNSEAVKGSVINDNGHINLANDCFANMQAGDEYTIVVSSDVYANDLEFTITIPDYIYAYADVKYADYWKNQGVYKAEGAEWDESGTEADSKGEYDKGAFDAVTRATINHGLHRGSFQQSAIIHATTTDGKNVDFNVSHWSADGTTIYCTNGLAVTWNRGTLTYRSGRSEVTATMKNYEITGIKYVPVRIAVSDYADFYKANRVTQNGEALVGGFSEMYLQAYAKVADVSADTYGLMTVSKDGDGWKYDTRNITGEKSGIWGEDLDSKNNYQVNPIVKYNSGYGDFLRMDVAGDYGALGSAMQSVVWEYYGADNKEYNGKPIRTYGTTFAADNWMHKMMNIQLGLTESLRCQLPEDYNGGYWRVTVRALGFSDSVFDIYAEPLKEEEMGDKEAFKDYVDGKIAEIAKLKELDYTAKSWEDLQTELNEAIELANRATPITKAAIEEATTHLEAALVGLIKLDVVEYAEGVFYGGGKGFKSLDTSAEGVTGSIPYPNEYTQKVKVTTKKDADGVVKISDIDIIEFLDDKEPFGIKAEKVLPYIIRNNGVKNANIEINQPKGERTGEIWDAMSGATYSTRGILEACTNALEASQKVARGEKTDIVYYEIDKNKSKMNTELAFGEKLNLKDLVLLATYGDGSTESIAYADCAKYGIKFSVDDGFTIEKGDHNLVNQVVTFSDKNNKANFRFVVKFEEKVVQPYVKKMTLTFADGKTQVISADDNNFSYDLVIEKGDSPTIKSVKLVDNTGEEVEASFYQFEKYTSIYLNDSSKYLYGTYRLDVTDKNITADTITTFAITHQPYNVELNVGDKLTFGGLEVQYAKGGAHATAYTLDTLLKNSDISISHDADYVVTSDDVGDFVVTLTATTAEDSKKIEIHFNVKEVGQIGAPKWVSVTHKESGEEILKLDLNEDLQSAYNDVEIDSKWFDGDALNFALADVDFLLTDASGNTIEFTKNAKFIGKMILLYVPDEICGRAAFSINVVAAPEKIGAPKWVSVTHKESGEEILKLDLNEDLQSAYNDVEIDSKWFDGDALNFALADVDFLLTDAKGNTIEFTKNAKVSSASKMILLYVPDEICGRAVFSINVVAKEMLTLLNFDESNANTDVAEETSTEENADVAEETSTDDNANVIEEM